MRSALIPLFCLGPVLALASALALAPIAAAQVTTVYEDDFESGVSGWSPNRTDSDPDVSQFLGRFDNSPRETSRTFALPAGTDRVEIQFDFYKFDSWDDTAQWGFDRFEIDVDGTEIFSLPFAQDQAARSGTSGTIDWSHSPLTPVQELAFNTGQFWFDQLHRVNITVNAPGSTLDLTLRTDINQGGNDESGGYDNFLVRAFQAPPNLAVEKTMDVVDLLGNGGFATPGNLVEYTFDLENTGGPVDTGSIVLLDPLPDNLTLFTGDLDGNGQPVRFVDLSTPPSGITCCIGANIDYSNSTAPPITFGYTPALPYDPAVTHIRITPSGGLRDGQTDTVETQFVFRARID